MPSQDNFSLLRKILKTLGLSEEAINDIVERIEDFLYDKDKKPADEIEYPYVVRDDFLSPAEHNFYFVLKSVVSDNVLICPKVSLGDLFHAKTSDASKFRIYRNKIDRKHVDYLLCDPKTIKPILGIELDDKSHQRGDRQTRDEFVENVFKAARLPLVRIPVKHSYSTNEIGELVSLYLTTAETLSQPQLDKENMRNSPKCPKCGSEMVLRTAKSGANQGNQFWGCSNYPQCRGIVRYEILERQ